MKEVLEELKNFAATYFETDYIDKNRQLYITKAGFLDEDEKTELLDFLTERCSVALFFCFCEETKTILTPKEAMQYSLLFCENAKAGILYSAYQTRVKDFFLGLPQYIIENNLNDYYMYVLRLSVEYDCIFALQALLEEDKSIHFITEDLQDLYLILEKQQDMRIAENVRAYLTSGDIGEDWTNYMASSKYVPDIFVDYFESEGKEICKENLKSYKKSKLLSNKTTLEELNAFVDSYNWDDGVEIPYFIMHHKNCDLALRKKLFELGAGDCIDESTYIDTKKDPWKLFILELKEMIEKEEQ